MTKQLDDRKMPAYNSGLLKVAMQCLTLLTIILFVSCGGQNRTGEENQTTVSVDKNTINISVDSNKTIVGQRLDNKTVYKILHKTNSVPGDIDTTISKSLNEPIRALAAFYAAMGGTMCDGENCELTTALGLGKQGSDKHKDLIKNYFPNDKVAETVLKQDCYLRPSGASTFSDFEYLTITDLGDTVEVDYNLMYYNRGNEEWTKGPDTYLFKDNSFKKIKRNLWTHSDK